jgi:uncharacterized cupin superfamily protein
MPNIYSTPEHDTPEPTGVKVGLEAGAEHLGASVYVLAPGQSTVFHYHLQREELLIVIAGTLSLRTADGLRDLPAGEVVSFPRGAAGLHGFENRTGEPVRFVVASEQNAPNISVYPDAGEIGIFDAAHPADRRFGARFRVDDAVSGYGGAPPVIAPEP